MPSQVIKLVMPELGAGRKIINLPRTNSILELYLQGNFDVGNVDPALANWGTYITRLELLIDGHAVWDVSMASYIAYLQHYGMSPRNGTLPMYFVRPWEDVIEARNHARLGTADLQSLQLGVTFTALAINSFNVYAKVGANEPIGQFIGLTERPETISASGLYDVRSIPSSKPYGSLAFHINKSDISDIELYFGSLKVDETNLAARAQSEIENGRTNVANWTHLNLQRNGDIREVLPMNNGDFLMRIRAGSALGATTILHEYVQDFSQYRRALA